MGSNTSNAAMPLSQSQLGLYLESVRNPEKLMYHIPFLFRFSNETPESLAAAMRRLIEAYPGISARIELDAEGNPVWQDPTCTPKVEVEMLEMDDNALLESAQDMVVPFDFSQPSPLARIKVIKTEKAPYLFMDFHHTIFDGTAMKLTMRALDAALKGETLPEEKVSIYELSRREHTDRAGEAWKEAKAQYAAMLEGCDGTFDVLPDVASVKPGAEETYHKIAVDLGFTQNQYDVWCKGAGMPLSVPATAAMGLVYQLFNRREDVVFSTVYHGRKGHDFDNTFAMMVKTLPVRVKTGRDTTVAELLLNVKKDMKTARDFDLYSFMDAAADFGLSSDFMFSYQGSFLDKPEINGAPLDEVPMYMLATGSKITAQLFFYGERPVLEVEYRSDLFSEELMRTLASVFDVVLGQFLTLSSETPVSALALADVDEAKDALLLSEGGPSSVPADATVVGLFREAAAAYPDNVAVVYRGRKLTYRELDAITDRLAVMLKKNYEIRRESVVGIMIERSELMAIFPIAVMKAGGAYMPLDPHFPEDRLSFMIEDAGVNIILSDDGLAETVVPSFKGEIVNASVLETLEDSDAGILEDPAPDSAMVYLYTSGSTGKPKGVVLEQHNIANYMGAYTDLVGMTSEDRTGAYANFGFDAHMMDLYPTLSKGATVHIFDSEIRMDLTAMYEYMEREKITVIFMTTQIVWQMATLFEFSSLRVLCGGGEKLPPLKALPYQFFNLYGPTECSVICTALRVQGATDGKDIGRPIKGYDVRILDRYMRVIPKGVPGELVVLGAGVGRGYLHRPDLNAEKFVEIDGIKAYRTGDYARFMPDGDIEFIGRSDGLVKLRGLRIELGEVDAVASGHPGVKTFVAAVKKIGNLEMLVGYYTPADGSDLTPELLQEYMGGELTEFMVPELIMKIDEMPLTPNGKVDRKRLPVPEKKLEEVVAPEGEKEQALFDITAEVLGHDNFGVTSNLLSAGLTSLMAMRLVAAVAKKMGVKLTAKGIMSSPTIRAIAKTVEESGSQDAPAAAKSAPKRKYYPLTENQRGVYIDWEMNRDALQYNIPQAFKFAPGTDAERLKAAVMAAVEAHPGLMTRMVWRNGDVMQEPHGSEDFNIEITQLDRMPDADFFQSKIRPFHLYNDVLFRCEIFKYLDTVYMLMDNHHIIFDGMSAMVMMEDIRKAYAGEKLDGEEYSALDHALYEKDLLESDGFEKAELWFDTLIGDSESTSYPRSAHPDNDIAGGMGRIRLSMKSAEIRKFCTARGLTVSNYLLSSFLQLLHRLVRENTVQITTVNNGRNDIRLLADTGMFVKTLPVVSRCEKPREITPAQFAEEIQKQFLTTQDNDFYPFTSLVDRKGIHPEIMYVYEGGIDMSMNSGALSAEEIPLALNTAKVPLTLLVYEDGKQDFELVLEYDTSYYCLDDMAVLLHMMSSLSQSLTTAETVADGVMTDSRALDVLGRIRDGKKCDVPYRSMHGEMENRADETPDVKAVVACDRTLTYREFDNECNRIANALIKRGVEHGDRIVILLPRRASLISAIFGAMKTGSAYIPCDPDYPAERIRLITEDSGARYIITTADRVPLYENAVDIEDLLEETDTKRPGVAVGPEDVAYMIYTSGSTGRPKGVMIPQRGICNYTFGYYDKYYRNRPEVKTEMLLVTISFDASLNNLAVSLTCGHTLVLANEEECKDVIMLSKLMLDNHVDSFDTTPSRLDAMLDLPEFRKAISQCSHLNIGGEGFQTALIAKLFEAGFHGKAINEYGPTETTVGSNHYELSPYTPVIAGPPFYNEWQRVVDAWGGELPVGAVGELYIFGRGLGLGYNNLPEKTAEAYVEYHGERGYRTGDLARWTPEGEIVILGRIDHQVKLRGLRIELGEIESVALDFKGIGKVAANVVEVNKIQHLVLYYTSPEELDTDALQEHLASRLTEYMVPDSYMRIEEMPLTPNGKTNRKALPLPEIAGGAEYVAPEGKLETLICDAFGSVLGNDRVGVNDDFFSIGGTSISAIKVVAAISLGGYSVTYKNVFEARTPRALAELISGKKQTAAAVTPSDVSLTSGDHQKSEFEDVLKRNTIDAFLTGKRQELGDVLLTGATGFMGIHMLHRLLTEHDGKIICLLRRKGDISPESRLRTLLFYYFDNSFEEAFESGRIRIVECDVTTPVPDDVAATMEFQTVVNCAANVKHFSAGNDIELVNVESVRNLIALCEKKNARLIHVSTVSIAGESVNGYPDPDLLLTEHMMDFGQSLANQYVSSKYKAEELILTAVRDKGFNGKIMRVGNLSARASDGEFQINFSSNAFMGRLKAYTTLGCAPYAVLDAPCEFSPIDEVCGAILLLATTPSDMVVFHPCNNHRLPLGDVLHILNEAGCRVDAVENDVFMNAEREAMDEPEKVNALQPLLAYDSDKASQTTFIRYDSSFTSQILYRLGFRWDPTSHEYVSRFIQAIKSLNFFEA